MGNISALTPCHYVPPTLTYPHVPPKQGWMQLSVFRGQLQPEECFFVLSSLLRQYFGLFCHSGKIVVSDQLCFVSQLGEVKVDQPLELIPLQATLSFVTALSQILETVGALSEDGSWLESRDSSELQARLTRIIYRNHLNDYKLYQEIAQQVAAFTEQQRMRSNLLPALLRQLHSLPLNPTPPTFTPSFAPRHSATQTNHPQPLPVRRQQSTEQEIPQTNPKMSRKNIYRHKAVRTQGEEYFGQAQRKSLFFEATTELPISSISKNNHISAQYCLNIVNSGVKEKINKVKFKKQHRDSINWDKNPRNQTSLNEMGEKKPFKHARTYTKSVLEELARSVEVKEEPSSKSYIF